MPSLTPNLIVVLSRLANILGSCFNDKRQDDMDNLYQSEFFDDHSASVTKWLQRVVRLSLAQLTAKHGRGST